MKATLEAFLQSLQKLSREQLIQKLVQMKENEMNQTVILTEMRNTSTAMTRDYNKVLESNRKLQAENTQLKKDYKTVCEQNAQLLRKVFGRQSEKMIYMDEEAAPEDPLAEDTVVKGEPEEGQSADPPKGKLALLSCPGKRETENRVRE